MTDHWESPDFCTSKSIIYPGLEGVNPRLGSKGRFRVQRDTLETTSQSNIQLKGVSSFFSLDNGNEDFEVEFEIGMAVGEVDEAFEKLLKTMEVGETCSASIRIHFKGVEDWMLLELTLTLLKKDFERGLPLWHWSSQKKLEFAGRQYSQAVDQVKKSNFATSFRKFRSALTLCRFVLEHEKSVRRKLDNPQPNSQQIPVSTIGLFEKTEADEKIEETEAMAGKCSANLTLCHLKLGNFDQVVAMATENLTWKPDDVKAFYRRGTARLELNDYEEAVSDFVEACRLDPSLKAAQQSLARAQSLKQKNDQKMGKAMKKMFSS